MGTVYDIAIIGAGPAGIAAAVESVIGGMKEVILFEKGENHSMTIRKYYKDNKRVDKDWKGQTVELNGNIDFTDGTKESTLDLFDKMLDDHQVNALFNTEIDSVVKETHFLIKTTDGELYEARNVIVAIGSMGKPNKPSYKIPPSIKQRVNFNLDHCSKGEEVLVVGGGNTAAEYAYYLADTNNVTLNYRRGSFSRLNPENEKIVYECVEQKRMFLKLGVDVTSLEGEKGQIKVTFGDGMVFYYDRIIYALGGVMPTDMLKKCGIAVDEKGRPVCNADHETPVPGLYVAGDVAIEIGGSIAAGLNHAFKIVNHIKNRL